MKTAIARRAPELSLLTVAILNGVHTLVEGPRE